MPVHPCGSYRLNSVVSARATRAWPTVAADRCAQRGPMQQEILYRVHKAPKLYLVHRLDKLTSGLLLMAKNKTKAQELSAKIQDHNMKKTYLARVNGKFPECVTKREVRACVCMCARACMHVRAGVGAAVPWCVAYDSPELGVASAVGGGEGAAFPDWYDALPG